MKGTPGPVGKDRILLAFNKLNDRDTYKTSVEELVAIVAVIQLDVLPVFINQLTSQASELKPFAKRECIKLCILVTSDNCPA